MNAEWPIRHSQRGNTEPGDRPSVKVIDAADDVDLLRQRHSAENRINALLQIHFRWRGLCDDTLHKREKNNSDRQPSVVSGHLLVSRRNCSTRYSLGRRVKARMRGGVAVIRAWPGRDAAAVPAAAAPMPARNLRRAICTGRSSFKRGSIKLQPHL